MINHQSLAAAARLVVIPTLISIANLAWAQPVRAESPRRVGDVIYRDDSAAAREHCRLDIDVPVQPGATDMTTIVWFHGGGLTGGKRELPAELIGHRRIIVAVDYRLTPMVDVAGCIDDAAAAVGWVHEHIAEYGGDPKRIVLSGHSAGGYLTLMLGLDKSYLAKYRVNADDLLGLAPLSGHTITHFTARKQLGLSDTEVLVNELAPLAHLRAETPAIHCVTGDRELEMLGRYEENAYFVRMMKVVGNPRVTLQELAGRDHGGMRTPGLESVNLFVDGL